MNLKRYFKYFFTEERYVDNLKQVFSLVLTELNDIESKLIKSYRYNENLIKRVWNLQFKIIRTLKEIDNVNFWKKKKYYMYYDKCKGYEKEFILIKKLNFEGKPKGQKFIPIDPFGEENWEE